MINFENGVHVGKINNLTIGMGQLLVEGGEPERNLSRARQMILESVEKKVDIVLLPEVFDLGWTHPSALKEAQTIPGAYSDFLCDEAKRGGIYICAGLTEKESDKVFNTAVLIDRKGNILVKYRKINLLTVEQPFYQIGSKLEVVDTEFGLIGINICADNYSDSLEIGHVLAKMGAQIILSPSSWTSDYHYFEGQDPYEKKWLKPYQTLAYLYDLVIAGATSVGYIVGGPYEGKKMVGCSLAVGKNGIISQGKYNEFAGELVISNFDVPDRKEKGTELCEMTKNKGYFNFLISL